MGDSQNYHGRLSCPVNGIALDPFHATFWTESCENINFSISHWSLRIGFSICFMVEKTCRWGSPSTFGGNATSVTGKSLRITFYF